MYYLRELILALGRRSREYVFDKALEQVCVGGTAILFDDLKEEEEEEEEEEEKGGTRE